MKSCRRYAIFYSPRPAEPLAGFGADWLGYDAETGRAVTRSVARTLPSRLLDEITRQPARYGFHATLKAPFFLADGYEPGDLLSAVRVLAHRLRPVVVPALELKRIGQFFALVPQLPDALLQNLARQCVEALDPLRAPLLPEERRRRLGAGLSERQQKLLEIWGYPFVMEEYRFHLTLTGSLDDTQIRVVEPELVRLLAQHLRGSARIEDLCIFGETGADQPFRLLHRAPLVQTG